MTRSYTTFEKFEEFFGGSRRSISLTSQNTLFLDAGYTSAQYVEVAPDRFRQVNGQEELVFHRRAGSPSLFFLSSWPATTVERLAWWTDPTLQKALLGACIGLLLAVLVSLGLTHREAAGYPRQLRWLRWSVGVVGGLNVLFCCTFIPLYVREQGHTYLYGLSLTMQLLLLIPVAAAIAAAGMVSLVAFACLRGSWNGKLRIQSSIATLSAVYMLWFTQYYNIFGLPV
jgi:hypothetical protein